MPGARPRVWFAAAVVAWIAAGAAPRLAIAFHQRIEYDGWWLVFISRLPFWMPFLRDVVPSTHPPLYYFALRFSQDLLGRTHFAYRAASLVSGLAAIPLAAWIGRRAGCSRLASAVIALVVAASESAAVISCEVRPYALAIAFMLVAFGFLQQLTTGTPGRFTLTLLAVFTGAAAGTHYFGFLFAGAVVAIAAAAAVQREQRALMRVAVTPLAIVTTGIVAVLMALLVIVQVRRIAPMTYLASYYFDPRGSRTAGAFFLENLQRVVNLFSPLSGGSRGAAIGVAVVVGCVVAAGFAFRRLRPVAAMAALLFIAIVAGGFAAAYPFGGEMRQQYFVVPFLVIAMVGVADAAVAKFPAVRTIVLLVVAAAAIANGVAWWRSLVIEPDELFANQSAIFRRAFPGPRTVALDQYSLIAFFMHNEQTEWRLRAHDGVLLADVYSLGDGTTILRDRQTWNYDCRSRASFLRLRQLMKTMRQPAVTLFCLRQFNPAVPAPSGDPAAVRSAAASAGLVPGRVAVSGSDVFAEVMGYHAGGSAATSLSESP